MILHWFTYGHILVMDPMDSSFRKVESFLKGLVYIIERSLFLYIFDSIISSIVCHISIRSVRDFLPTPKIFISSGILGIFLCGWRNPSQVFRVWHRFPPWFLLRTLNESRRPRWLWCKSSRPFPPCLRFHSSSLALSVSLALSFFFYFSIFLAALRTFLSSDVLFFLLSSLDLVCWYRFSYDRNCPVKPSSWICKNDRAHVTTMEPTLIM